MGCEQCNKKKDTARKAGNAMVLIAGWFIGACAIAGGATLISLSDQYRFVGLLGIMGIVAGIYTIAEFSVQIDKEDKKAK